MSFQIGNKMDTQAPFNLAIKDIINGRTYIASITRYGKSWTCRKIVEETFGHCSIILFDPEGEYSSLREKYPFLIIGIDVPIQIETAEFMAEQVLKNGLSVIIDTSKERNDKEYVRRFLEQFFYLETTARKPYLLIVEEAEDYGPEKGAPGSAECLPALIAFAKKGGKRGIGCIFVGHRPAWISKGILSQCSNKALGKIESTDFKALEEYARVPRSVIEKLPDLKPGEFCFTGDWIKDEQMAFVKVGNVKTTHLGMTPEIIPPSPKALESIIENLQRSLSKVIETVKPKVESVSETEKRLREKFDTDTAAIRKTADEKAERKYHGEIEKLQNQLGDASRALTLQTQTPIANVLEHPIVKARMAQTDQRSRDLLVKIEQEPGLTREVLAAFLSTSTNTVAGVIDQINRVFKAQAIVDDGGRPIKYRSMLKRLYLTDVARREIDELSRLQREVREKGQIIEGYKSRLTEVQANAEKWKAKSESTEQAYEQFQRQTEQALVGTKKRIDDLEEEEKKLGAKLEVSNQENERLDGEVKRLRQLSKIGEEIEEVVKAAVKAGAGESVVAGGEIKSEEPVSVDHKEIQELKAQVETLTKKVNSTSLSLPQGVENLDVTLTDAKTVFHVEENIKHVKGTTDNAEGKILCLAKEGFFSDWKSQSEIETKMQEQPWTIPRITLYRALSELEKDGTLAKIEGKPNKYKLARGISVEA